MSQELDITAEVSQDCIAAGVRQSCEACPIALAIKRALPKGFKVVGVGEKTATVLDLEKRKELIADLPLNAVSFIFKFDQGERLELLPFSFSLKFRVAYSCFSN